MSTYKIVPLDNILPPTIALRIHDESAENIQELATDFIENGMDTPVVVLDNGDGTFTLNDGSRRLTAANKLFNEGQSIKDVELGMIAVRVVGLKSDWSTSDELANQMRLNVQVLETSSKDYFTACLKLAGEGWSAKKIAEKISKSPSLVGSWLRSLAVPQGVKDLVIEGEISLSIGKILSENKRKFDDETLLEVAEHCRDEELTTEQASEYITKLIAERQEAGSTNHHQTEPVFVLTQIVPKADYLMSLYSDAIDKFGSNPTPFNEGFVEAIKTVYQIDAGSAEAREQKFNDALTEKAETARKKKESNLLKNLGVKVVDFISENGEDAFKQLIETAKAAE